MKKYIALGFAALILILLVVTCPKKSDHQEALKEVMNEAVNDAADLSVSEDDDGWETFGKIMGGAIVNYVVEKLLDTNFTYHNYVLFSVGELQNGEKHKRVTFGILNQVITPSKEDLTTAIKETVNGKDEE